MSLPARKEKQLNMEAKDFKNCRNESRPMSTFWCISLKALKIISQNFYNIEQTYKYTLFIYKVFPNSNVNSVKMDDENSVRAVSKKQGIAHDPWSKKYS